MTRQQITRRDLGRLVASTAAAAAAWPVSAPRGFVDRDGRQADRFASAATRTLRPGPSRARGDCATRSPKRTAIPSTPSRGCTRRSRLVRSRPRLDRADARLGRDPAGGDDGVHLAESRAGRRGADVRSAGAHRQLDWRAGAQCPGAGVRVSRSHRHGGASRGRRPVLRLQSEQPDRRRVDGRRNSRVRRDACVEPRPTRFC